VADPDVFIEGLNAFISNKEAAKQICPQKTDLQ
jgi:hypothetical protein